MYNLVYMAKPIYGGWVTYTAHLSLKNDYPIYKIGKRTEKNKRDYGYNCKYQNLVIEDLMKKENLMITALDKHYYEYLQYFPKDTILVIHDPTELKNKSNPLIRDGLIDRFKIITIRQTVKDYLMKTYKFESQFLTHPFYQYEKNKPSMNNYAVSISRIDFDKNIDIILKYNKLIENEDKCNNPMDKYNPMDKCIKIFGKENRLYVHHKLKDLNFHDYWHGSYPKNLPMTYTTAGIERDILKDCKFMVDLSTIKDDGGGTQYTFLEAIYNDCILILNREWIDKGNLFVENENCLAVKDEYELRDILLDTREYDKDKIIENARKILENH
tara:strand:- start:62 stop:1045 length:984 start_codon:yes stop_codon:yes gene_type:complete